MPWAAHGNLALAAVPSRGCCSHVRGDTHPPTLHLSAHPLPPASTHPATLHPADHPHSHRHAPPRRFQSTYLGSRALIGSLLDSGLLQNRDTEGKTVVDALEAFGYDASSAAIGKIGVPPSRVSGRGVRRGTGMEAGWRPSAPSCRAVGQG